MSCARKWKKKERRARSTSPGINKDSTACWLLLYHCLFVLTLLLGGVNVSTCTSRQNIWLITYKIWCKLHIFWSYRHCISADSRTAYFWPLYLSRRTHPTIYKPLFFIYMYILFNTTKVSLLSPIHIFLSCGVLPCLFCPLLGRVSAAATLINSQI